MADRLSTAVGAALAVLETELGEGACPPEGKVRLAVEAVVPLVRDMVAREISARADEILSEHVSMPHDSTVYSVLSGYAQAETIARTGGQHVASEGGGSGE